MYFNLKKYIPIDTTCELIIKRGLSPAFILDHLYTEDFHVINFLLPEAALYLGLSVYVIRPVDVLYSRGVTWW